MEADTTEAIVRDLADLGSPHDDEHGECILCGSTPDYPYEDHVSDHEPSCPWRRAIEWERQPTGTPAVRSSPHPASLHP